MGLPFLPAYTDASFKIKTRFDSHNELTLLGLGGIDRMKLNLGIEGEDAEYMLSYLPEINQETYTVGGVYRHYSQRHVQSIVLSQSYLNNRNVKYRDNDESSEENLTLRLGSIEQETKLRMENTSSWSVWKVKAGFDLNYSRYKSNEYRKVFTNACGNMITIPICLSGVGECLPQSIMPLLIKVSRLPWAYVPTEITIAIK